MKKKLKGGTTKKEFNTFSWFYLYSFEINVLVTV